MMHILTVKSRIRRIALIMFFLPCFCHFAAYAAEAPENEKVYPGSVTDKDAALSEDDGLTEEEDKELQVKLDEIDRKYDLSASDNGMTAELLENPELKVSYDPDTGSFSYTMPNGASFRTTFPLGSLYCGRAVVETGDEAYIERLSFDGELYKNEGEAAKPTVSSDNADKQVMTSFGTERRGNYCFRIDSQVRAGMKIRSCRVSASFRLIEEREKLRMDVLKAPYGYRIKEVNLEGRALNAARGDSVELSRDGNYGVIFEAAEGNWDTEQNPPEYRLSFIRDTTPPLLSFSKDIRQGPVEGPLEYYRSEEDTEIKIFWNGQELESAPDPVRATGDYRIEAKDPCGNVFSYEFRVQNKSGMPGRYYIMIALIMIVFCVIVVMRSHKSMRII